MIRRKPRERKRKDAVLVFLTKAFIPTPPSSHPQSMRKFSYSDYMWLESLPVIKTLIWWNGWDKEWRKYMYSDWIVIRWKWWWTVQHKWTKNSTTTSHWMQLGSVRIHSLGAEECQSYPLQQSQTYMRWYNNGCCTMTMDGWQRALPGIAGLLDVQGLIGTRQGTYGYNMNNNKTMKHTKWANSIGVSEAETLKLCGTDRAAVITDRAAVMDDRAASSCKMLSDWTAQLKPCFCLIWRVRSLEPA